MNASISECERWAGRSWTHERARRRWSRWFRGRESEVEGATWTGQKSLDLGGRERVRRWKVPQGAGPEREKNVVEVATKVRRCWT